MLIGFDKYWAKSLEESKKDDDLFVIEPLNIDKNGVSCDWLYFLGIDNQRIACMLFRPSDRTKSYPAICIFHGYNGKSSKVSATQTYSDIIEYAKQYTCQGFVTLIMFSRGQSVESSDNHIFSKCDLHHLYLKDMLSENIMVSYCRALFSDATKCVRILMKLEGVNSSDVSLVGYSQGGDIAVACAALQPEVKKVICGGVSIVNYEKIMFETNFIPKSFFGVKLTEYFEKFDKSHKTEQQIKNKMKYIDLLQFAPKITAEVLYVMRENDSVCLSEDQLFFYNALSNKKNIVFFEGADHLLPIDFFLNVPQILKDEDFPNCKMYKTHKLRGL